MAAFRAPDPGGMSARVSITRLRKDGVDIAGHTLYATDTLADSRSAQWVDTYGADAAMDDEARHRLSAQVTLRYLSGVEPYCKVQRKGDDNEWDVVSAIDPTGKKQWLQMVVERVVQR